MRSLSTIPIRQGPSAPPRARPPLQRRSPRAACHKLRGPLGAFERYGGMRANSRPGARVARAVAANPRIEITPTEAQYEQLCSDLKKLRRAGAISNTVAIIEAVRVAAGADKVGGRPHKEHGGRSPASQSSNRR